MAYFAQLDSDWVVQQIIAVHDSVLLGDNGTTCEWLGVQFCQQLYGPGHNWLQVTYPEVRYKVTPGIGYRFDPVLHEFFPPTI